MPAPPRHLMVAPGMMEELKGRDQAIVTSLVVNSETVSVESFGTLRKLFVLIRAQALFFDFKSTTVVRSYPLSFAYIDVLDREPTSAEILTRVQAVYKGTNGKPGIFARYANVLASATIPTQVPRLLKVAKIALDPSVTASLPSYLKSEPGMAETWAADMVSEAIPTRAGVPPIPFTQGYAVGYVFAMRVSDGSVFSLKLPESDYTIAVDLTGIKKVKFGSVAAGDSFVYGTYATVKIEQPQMGTAYLSTALKNGETKVVPATQTYVDDFPAYYGSWNVAGWFSIPVKHQQAVDFQWLFFWWDRRGKNASPSAASARPGKDQRYFSKQLDFATTHRNCGFSMHPQANSLGHDPFGSWSLLEHVAFYLGLLP